MGPSGRSRDRQAKNSKTTPCTVAGDTRSIFRIIRNLLMRRANQGYIAILAHSLRARARGEARERGPIWTRHALSVDGGATRSRGDWEHVLPSNGAGV